MSLGPLFEKRRLLLVAVAGLVVVALRLAAPRSPLPGAEPNPSSPPNMATGKAPSRIGSIALCPTDAPYRAFRSSDTYYPPDHPALPPGTVFPTRCFPTARDAVAAGYSLAPPPTGVQVVGGVYLVPTDPVLLGQCRKAALWLGYPVPCPRLMPERERGAGPLRCGAGPADQFMRGCVLTNVLPRERPSMFLLVENVVAIPPEYAGGLFPLTSAVQVEAYPARPGRSVASRPFLECFPSHVESSVRVRLRTGVFIRCGQDPSGTLVLQLRRSTPTEKEPIVEIAIRGPLEADHDLLKAVANHLRMVGP